MEDDLLTPCSKYIYTDGVGRISRNLMQNIHTLIFKNSNPQKTPLIAAIQVRVLGSKGMLVRDDTLDDNRVVLRKSMCKFHDKTIEKATQHI